MENRFWGRQFPFKDIMPNFVLKSIYYAHVHSVLSYCNLIWSGAHCTTLKGLVTIQKRIIRNITHSSFDAHTAPLFTTTKILNIEQTRILIQPYTFMKMS